MRRIAILIACGALGLSPAMANDGPDLAAADAAATIDSGEAAVPEWRLDINATWTGLDGGRPDWWEIDTRLSRRVRPEITLSALVDWARRSGAENTLFEGRIDYKPGPLFSGYFFLAGTPDATFFPQVAIGSGLAYKIRDAAGPINASVLLLDAKYADYVTGPVHTLNAGIEQYFHDGRFWLTARMVNVVDQDGVYSPGYAIRGDWQATDRLRLFAGFADAPETIDADVVRTHAIFGGLVYDISSSVTWRLSIGHVDLFDQISVGTGLSRKF